VIDSVPNNNTQYFAVTDAGGLNEVLNCTTHGGIGEYNFAISTDYQHKLYLGLSVGFRTLSYERRWEFNEVDSKNIQSKLDKASYTANQLTEGNGVNIKVGAIYRLLDFVRLGLAYESPTYYGMKYNLIHSLSSNFKNGELWDATQSTDFTYDYKTPSRLTLSLAAQYKSNLMFSVDADFVNYQNTNFFSNDYGYENENQDLTKELHRTMNLRAGVEFKQGILALRAGYAHQGNPYSDKVSVDATRRTFTLGAGVRSAAFFADIAYTHATTASQEFFVEKYENFNPILDLTQNSAVISLGFFF
jgi:hypothetical protein